MTEEVLLFTPNRWKDVQSPANKKYKTQSTRIRKGKAKKHGKSKSKLPSILTSSKMYNSLYTKNQSQTSRGNSGFQFSTFAKRSCSFANKSTDRLGNSKTLDRYQSISSRNRLAREDQNDIVHADEWVDNIKFGIVSPLIITKASINRRTKGPRGTWRRRGVFLRICQKSQKSIQ